MLITDMNNRERNAFAGKAENLASCATQLATALRASVDGSAGESGDIEILTSLLLASTAGWFIKDLSQIFEAATRVDVPADASLLAPGAARDHKPPAP